MFFRPPGTLVPKALYFTREVFLFFPPRDLQAPSADRRETLPHDRNMGALYNASPKIWGALPPKKLGAKTCKIWLDFRQHQTSIANISGKGQDIQNRKDMISDSPRVPPKKSCELWSTNYRELCQFEPTQIPFFGRLYLGP